MFGHDPLAYPEPLIRRVYAYVAYRIGEGPDAEDVTSETFERALRYRHTYDRRKGDPAAWLVGIARRLLGEARSPATAALDEAPEPVSVEQLEEEAADRLTLTAAMRKLDARDRELLALRYGADMTAREIAELLDARTNTIEVALHRALDRMRAILDDESERETSKASGNAVRVQGSPPV